MDLPSNRSGWLAFAPACARKAAYSSPARRGRVRGLNGPRIDREPVLDLAPNLNGPLENRRRNNRSTDHWRRHWLGQRQQAEAADPYG